GTHSWYCCQFSLQAASRSQRDANVDSGSFRRPGVDCDLAGDQAQAFTHANKPEPLLTVDQTRLEAAPVIDNAQLNRLRPADQLHVGVPRAAMLDHISDAF